MNSAASAVAPAEKSPSATRSLPHRMTSRRTALQLLAGLLVVAGIPVIATARILDANALRNARARADASVRVEAQAAQATLGRLSQDASNRADDLSRSPRIQRAFLTGDREALKRLAQEQPGVLYYLGGVRVAGAPPPVGLTRAVSLALNGKRIGMVVATIALDDHFARNLLRAIAHARGDQFLLIRGSTVTGSAHQVTVEGNTVRLAGRRYRATVQRIQNAPGVSLAALRPDEAVRASVSSYRDKVRYAAIGSLVLLVLIGLLFGGPILRSLSEFRRVASQAATDALTGLANRRSFDEELALEWRRSERVGDSLALILADIDDFKGVNDAFGHQVGDAVLRKVGEILTDGVRQKDLAARYGGEEFAVLTPETSLENGLRLAERLRTEIASARFELPDGNVFHLTASFGVAVKGQLPQAEELVAAADEALYDAKRAGKNRVAPAEAPSPPATKPDEPILDRRAPRETKKVAPTSATPEVKKSSEPGTKRRKSSSPRS